MLSVTFLVVGKYSGLTSTGTCQPTLSDFTWGPSTSKTPRWTLSCYMCGPSKQRRGPHLTPLFLVAGLLYYHTTLHFYLFISLLYLASFHCGFSQFWSPPPMSLDHPSPAVPTILSLVKDFIIQYPCVKPSMALYYFIVQTPPWISVSPTLPEADSKTEWEVREICQGSASEGAGKTGQMRVGETWGPGTSLTQWNGMKGKSPKEEMLKPAV